MSEKQNINSEDDDSVTTSTQPENTEKEKISGVTTTLDRIEFGSSDLVEADLKKTKKQRRELPETVSSKELYNDIVRIAWPSLAEMLLASLVSMVDMMMVGSLGANAIAAIGLALQPRFLLMSTVMALNTGVTAVIARARGAKDQKKANDILRQGLILATGIALLCAVFGTWGARSMIYFMSAGAMEQETVNLGTTYFQIQSATFVIPSLSFFITAALRGTGNSKPCMIFNITANIVNVIGNWLLIYGHLGFPQLGVAGAAIATVIGQSVGTAMAFSAILKGKYYLKLKISLSNIFKFDKHTVGSMTKVGLPAMIEQLIMRFGVIIYSRTVSSLGEISAATFQICLSIQSLSLMNGMAFAVSATTLVGQSLGKQRLDMAEHYGRRCRLVAMSISIFLAILFVLFRKQLIMLYTTDPIIVQTGGIIMIFVAFLQPFQSSQFVLGGVLRGAGDTKVTAVIILITTAVIRTSLGYIFITVLDFGLIGAWFAIGTDQILRSFLFLLRYNQGKWKRIKL